MEDTLFGYDIPMPRKDLFIAIATVAAFLPAVVIVHNLTLFFVRVLKSVFVNKKLE